MPQRFCYQLSQVCAWLTCTLSAARCWGNGRTRLRVLRALPPWPAAPSSLLPMDSLCMALNKYIRTSTAISFIPHWCLCFVLHYLEKDIPPLYFPIPVLSLGLYKSAPTSDPLFLPVFPCRLLSWQQQQGRHRKNSKGGTQFGPGKMRS